MVQHCALQKTICINFLCGKWQILQLLNRITCFPMLTWKIYKKNSVYKLNYLALFYLFSLFIVQAMHLVYKALEKYAIPSVLPPELMPPGKRKDIIMPKPKSPVPGMVSGSPSPQPPPIPPLPNTTTVKSLTGLNAVKVFIF